MHGPEESLLVRALVESGRVPASAPVSFRSTRVGVERGLTGVVERVEWSATSDESSALSGMLMLKQPRTGPEFERSAREGRFLGTLAHAAAAPAADCLARDIDPLRDRVLLVLDPAPGHDGDAVHGCTPDDADSVLAALAPMQAWAWMRPRLEAITWLPRWGVGTAESDTPHRRRAGRFRARCPMFLERFGAGSSGELPPLLARIAPGLEPLLGAAAALPTTLIHADLHLDNVRLGPPHPTVLDWQSVSRGPLAYDLARFLGEALRGDDHDTIDDLLERHVARLVALGVPPSDLADVAREFDAMLLRVVVGMVSGYGGRDPDAMPARERAIVEHTIGPGGLIDLVLRRDATGA